ncbi:hypothetical protein J2X15_002897 [Rhodoferax saidenbachensis]|uniref:Leucine-binding protein domain-containing protein n=1 Tax=Rhodoferax saidenbachensis TaxID=1484693 RepID=A0ABU1ZPY3_9BURK|nr:hypothetical protein [Rhodoferax saidenbachensis]
MTRYRLRPLLALAVLLLCATDNAGAAREPVVIGQSLPLTGAGFPVANRVLAGDRAHVERVNVSGGILGRPLELVTLDDGGDPQRVAANARADSLAAAFHDRLIGYTSVVPNLNVTRLPIVRDLQRDADAFIGPEAAIFEGLEAYLNLRLCTEALRRVGSRADGQRLGEALENLGTLDLGGFRLVLGRDRHHGSDYVEIGMRARDGRQLR